MIHIQYWQSQKYIKSLKAVWQSAIPFCQSCALSLFSFNKIWRKVRSCLLLGSLVASGLVLAGCSERLSKEGFVKLDSASAKPIRAYGARSDPAIVQIEPVAIPVEHQSVYDPLYRVGAGDRLSLNIFGESGLEDVRVAVDGEGFIQVPYLERLYVSGLSLGEIQGKLKAGFQQQFVNPWVVARVVEHRSRPVYLLGHFNKPGVVYLDGPTNVMQVMSLGEGLSETAHLQGARLWRGEQIVPVDLKALLMDGRAEHNVPLVAGDTLFIPGQGDMKAYVLGSVTRAGAVPFANEPMTLLKALAHVGGPKKETALISQIRIIRSLSAVEGQLIVVNAKDILRGQAPDLALMPDDIVYVPDNWIAGWNQVVQAIGPSLQLAGGVLQPFVQIKFLTED